MNNNIVLFKSTGEGYEITTINENGDVIKEPTYEVESNIIPSFIKEYYQVDLGYGEPYYTNEAIMKSTENVIKDEDLKNNDNKK